MTESRSSREPSYNQINNGSGTFIAGHNYGTVQTLDAKTKRVLDKLSVEAPALARLLHKALRDGLISPDIASSLEMAARNLNWDVAEALYTAGENINIDVAMALSHAGDNINPQTAARIDAAVERLSKLAAQIDQSHDTADKLSKAAQKPSNLRG